MADLALFPGRVIQYHSSVAPQCVSVPYPFLGIEVALWLEDQQEWR